MCIPGCIERLYPGRRSESGDQGIFNIASGNYTVGEVADLVKLALAQQLGSKIGLTIKHIHDFRNYKVSMESEEYPQLSSP